MSSPESSSNSSIDSCNCTEAFSPNKNETIHCCNNSQDFKGKKSNSLTLLAQNLRRGRSLNFTNKRVRKCNRQTKEPLASTSNSSKNKSNKWVMKFNCAKKERNCPEETQNMKCCVCTCYRRTDEHHLGAGVVFQQTEAAHSSEVQVNEVVVVKNETATSETKEVTESSSLSHGIPAEEVAVPTNNSSDVYGNLGSTNGGASIILGAQMLDVAW